MKLNSTVLFVKDIKLSVDFYQKYLDQQVEHDFGGNVIFTGGFAVWEIQKDHIINRDLTVIANSNRFELYFEHEDIPGLYDKLNNGDVKFLHPVREESWGQLTIRFFDPDKHLIEVAEPLLVFLSRMHNSGMTLEQVSARSSVPLETLMAMIG